LISHVFLSPTPTASVILSPLLSCDQMITGIRESGRPMAAGDRGIVGGRSSLSHVPPGLREFRKERPMRLPGQKAVTFFMLRGGRVASHTQQDSSLRQDHAPCASLGIFMIRPETGRDNAEGRGKERKLRKIQLRVTSACRQTLAACRLNRQDAGAAGHRRRAGSRMPRRTAALARRRGAEPLHWPAAPVRRPG
jgi:hypothetical protein